LWHRFQDEYFREPNRGYGGNVRTVFEASRDKIYTDIYEGAARQFDGQGSYGNGGAMRIVPAALFGYNCDQKELEVCTISEFFLCE
jgi:poly(ADP-ribose) glycohydrolase ARH3